LSEVTEEDEEILGHMMIIVNQVAQLLSLQQGYRVVVNNGKNGN
jgi:diadenosine tetraphosphate (Ap4A) HIT family hydrolase